MAEADPNIEAGVAEVIETPADAAGAEEQRQPVTVEDLARRYGWRPQEEYKGAAEDWRDAETFVDFGLNRNRDMGRDLRSLREGMERTARTTGEIMQREVERARAEERAKWEGRHDAAVEAGDTKAAREAVNEIAKLSVPAREEPDADAASFARDNAWFNNDRAARLVAVDASDAAASRGASVAEQLREAKEAVFKAFPQYAPAPAKPAPGVATPATRSAATTPRKRGFSDMPSSNQQVARDLARRGFGTIEGYTEQYWAGQKA